MSASPTGPTGERTRVWVLILAIAIGLLLCGCASVVFLVLTGIIAEPVTVIEGIVRIIESFSGG